MRLPTIQGVIRRRILVNFRADPGVIQSQLPARFRPKLQEVRPWSVYASSALSICAPDDAGSRRFSSENAATASLCSGTTSKASLAKACLYLAGILTPPSIIYWVDASFLVSTTGAEFDVLDTDSELALVDAVARRDGSRQSGGS